MFIPYAAVRLTRSPGEKCSGFLEIHFITQQEEHLGMRFTNRSSGRPVKYAFAKRGLCRSVLGFAFGSLWHNTPLLRVIGRAPMSLRRYGSQKVLKSLTTAALGNDALCFLILIGK